MMTLAWELVVEALQDAVDVDQLEYRRVLVFDDGIDRNQIVVAIYLDPVSGVEQQPDIGGRRLWRKSSSARSMPVRSRSVASMT